MSAEEENLKVDSQESWVRLETLINEASSQEVAEYCREIGSGEMARAISRLTEDARKKLFSVLTPEEAAGVLEDLPEEQAVDLIEEIEDAQRAADIVEELDSDDQADILQALDEEDAEGILQKMDPEDAQEARQLLAYDPDTAGGVMMTEFLAFPATWKVSDVLKDLEVNAELYAGYEVLYGYVVDESKRLLGVIKFRDLLLTVRSTPVFNIMVGETVMVKTSTSLDELDELFDRHDYFAVPVVDENTQLVGIVRRAELREAVAVKSDKTFLQSAGILGGEEFRNMPVFERSIRRLSVLSVNIALNLVAVAVIDAYIDTIEAVIALAVFLPVISDLSGCSGNQAIAVSIRELTLGLLKPHEFMRVVFKEAGVGVINGVALGILLAIVSGFWFDNVYLGIVVGSALALNTVVSVLVGGTVPLVLKKFNIDPAIASSPILTTFTDICGFFFVLSFATLLLAKLI